MQRLIGIFKKQIKAHISYTTAVLKSSAVIFINHCIIIPKQ